MLDGALLNPLQGGAGQHAVGHAGVDFLRAADLRQGLCGAAEGTGREGVEINTYSIIYDAIDEVKSTMQGMLDKVKKEIVTGEIEVKQVFKISKVGTVAGGLVIDGKVHNKDKARVIRDGIVIHTANIGALKRYKDDAKEVATGLECGLSLVNYNDIEVGDIIETFTEIEVEQKL